MESDAEHVAPAARDAATHIKTRQRDASHSPARASSVRSEARESDMNACWFLAEIAKVFWYDRHPRLRNGKPSVPQVPPPGSKSPEASSPDAT
ncbi:hypothetical protein ABH991_005344 [Bradyrhizobium ottawaense]|uniref:Uncharacterized protein n=1 Tax=Bradyrhizobium ottawaense TaxID=931866 RepID=A0A2U8PEP2_9BRAD|nr:hypothetical protein CIT37_31995 [Bradyrhizobium ottawaense]BBO12731.1 hypothetical protein TM102_42010 [Bradyrhizobium sp. TM102]BBO06125.1 hypothetical protein SG09_54750 [Bradyrhizobium ottawaense]GMO18679.1 hypothetical protein BwSH14_10580 [Bradyrhizobium ottawaense]GMO19869.1 hypothetical protein BwSF21_13060 [Bradyrhizobium ottawaense]